MRTTYSDIELDALRELANIGSGTAATSLSGLLGRPIDVAVPAASALPLADAIDAAGASDTVVTGVAVPLDGELEGTALMLFPAEDAGTLCDLLGVGPADSEMAASALSEVVNILCAAYVGAVGQMTGLAVEIGPPEAAQDMLGAIMGSILASSMAGPVALLLDSALIIEDASCSLSFLLLPAADGVDELLARLGLG